MLTSVGYERQGKIMDANKTRTPATPAVLGDPMRDRGVAFTAAEREALGLTGRLPSAVLTLDQQAQRAYQQIHLQGDDLAKNVYLEQLHDRNEVLYFKVLLDHLAELLPVVYDPVVGDAIERYSHEYRRPRGIYLSIDRPDDMEAAFGTLGLGPGDVDLIVCSDAEEILGIGDWGVGGIQISVGKLAVYTAAAGIDPRRVIPVSLDVGTDNEALLNDPLYLGNRHARVRGAAYDAFIARYLETASSMYPGALLHFEDFGASNARRILLSYRDRYRIFNDDMQGTGAVVMAGLFNALKVTGTRWRDQRVVILGGGTAGVGIADQIRDQMAGDGLDAGEATGQVWIVDLPGLLTEDMSEGLLDYQRPYARPAAEVSGWARTPVQVDPSAATRWPEMAALRQARAASGIITLQTVVEQVKPTILVGTSTAHGAFTQQVVEAMSAGRRAAGHLPDLQPVLQDRGHAGRHHRLVQGQGPGRHRPADRAGGVCRRDLLVRPGQQRPAVPGAGPGHDRGRRLQGDRRHAAGRGRGGRRPGRRHRTGRLPAARGGEPARFLGDRRGRRGPGRGRRRRRHRQARQPGAGRARRYVAAGLPPLGVMTPTAGSVSGGITRVKRDGRF